MMARRKGNFVFECDGCDAVLDSNTSNFEAADNMRRRAVWNARKHGDVWKHFCCDECSSDADG